MKAKPSRLALGTVQLGMEYGIANQSGRPSRQEAFSILDAAWQSGVNTLDTAPAYGESEGLLGEWISGSGASPLVVTKLSGLGPGVPPGKVKDLHLSQARASLERLRLGRLYAILLHEPADLYSHSDAVGESLEALKTEGLAEHVGVSICTSLEWRDLSGRPDIDIFQVPINLFDHRFIASDGGDGRKALLARSCFLQGLFFLDPKVAEAKVPGSGEPLVRLRELSASTGVSMRRLAVGFVLAQPGVESVVVGVESRKQLLQNLEAASDGALEPGLVSSIRSEFTRLPPRLLDPSKWPAVPKP